ncbi:MAG: hypothetical protein ACLUSL_13250 [Ruminococcus sp.]
MTSSGTPSAELLGRPASPEVTQKLREMVLESPQILGLHDLMIHDYGPLNMIGSCQWRCAAMPIWWRCTK